MNPEPDSYERSRITNRTGSSLQSRMVVSLWIVTASLAL